MTEVIGDPGIPGAEDSGSASPSDIAARSPLQLFWRRLRRDYVALVALAIIFLVVVVAIFAPLVTDLFGTPGPKVPADPSPLLDDFGQPLGPSAHHPFGIGRNGVDVFAQVVYGARTSLITASIATVLTMVIGVSVGLIAGYYRGWVDSLLSRTMDLVLAFPVLVLAVGIGVACSSQDGCLGGLLQPGLTVVIFVITLTSWPYMARIVRGQVLSLREREFVDAARSLGASDARIIFREILPNLVAPIIVYATVLIPQTILSEASLSFLGIGASTDTASWGAMLSNASSIFRDAWWYMTYPGAALLITVLAFNLVGDGLQDALNSKTAK
ncbi:MAG: transporter permease, partial [Solirubrobacterales bacterium]|nr:transporter permease [Solirubrobacterales bacterium]